MSTCMKQIASCQPYTTNHKSPFVEEQQRPAFNTAQNAAEAQRIHVLQKQNIAGERLRSGEVPEVLFHMSGASNMTCGLKSTLRLAQNSCAIVLSYIMQRSLHPITK